MASQNYLWGEYERSVERSNKAKAMLAFWAKQKKEFEGCAYFNTPSFLTSCDEKIAAAVIRHQEAVIAKKLAQLDFENGDPSRKVVSYGLDQGDDAIYEAWLRPKRKRAVASDITTRSKRANASGANSSGANSSGLETTMDSGLTKEKEKEKNTAFPVTVHQEGKAEYYGTATEPFEGLAKDAEVLVHSVDAKGKRHAQRVLRGDCTPSPYCILGRTSDMVDSAVRAALQRPKFDKVAYSDSDRTFDAKVLWADAAKATLLFQNEAGAWEAGTFETFVPFERQNAVQDKYDSERHGEHPIKQEVNEVIAELLPADAKHPLLALDCPKKLTTARTVLTRHPHHQIVVTNPAFALQKPHLEGLPKGSVKCFLDDLESYLDRSMGQKRHCYLDFTQEWKTVSACFQKELAAPLFDGKVVAGTFCTRDLTIEQVARLPQSLSAEFQKPHMDLVLVYHKAYRNDGSRMFSFVFVARSKAF